MRSRLNHKPDELFLFKTEGKDNQIVQVLEREGWKMKKLEGESKEKYVTWVNEVKQFIEEKMNEIYTSIEMIKTLENIGYL